MKASHRSKTTVRPTFRSFYCRWKNRVVRSCGRDGGPPACPLRNECPADILVSSLPEAPRILAP
jgi:hypothetical protein